MQLSRGLVALRVEKGTELLRLGLARFASVIGPLPSERLRRRRDRYGEQIRPGPAVSSADCSKLLPRRGPLPTIAIAMLRQTLFKRAAALFSDAKAELSSACTAPLQCRRFYSIQSQEDSIARLPGIDPSKLSITKSTTPKELLPPQELVFGRTFTGTHTRHPLSDLYAYNDASHRSHALNRVDSITRLASASNNTLSESES